MFHILRQDDWRNGRHAESNLPQPEPRFIVRLAGKAEISLTFIQVRLPNAMAGNLSANRQSDFLAGVDLFKRLPESCLDLLLKDSRVLDCAAGHLFFQAGELGNSLFVLEKGHVRTFRSDGVKTLTIARIEPPAIFGEMGCFGRGKYYYSAEALHDSRVRLIFARQHRSAAGVRSSCGTQVHRPYE